MQLHFANLATFTDKSYLNIFNKSFCIRSWLRKKEKAIAGASM